MNNSLLPVARKEGLVIQELPEEVLVYDLETDKAHCLNQTAAFVWEACDGRNSVADITRLFGNYSGTAVQEDLVWLAIDQLNEKKLLEKEIAVNFNGQTRREAIKKIGLAAVVALPIVSSLVAPQAASAVTGACPAGSTCTCTLAPACGDPAGCTCNSGNGTQTACAAGCTTCGGCTVNNGATQCTGTCS